MYYINTMNTVGRGWIAAVGLLAVLALFSVTSVFAQATIRKEVAYMSQSIGIIPGQAVRIGHFGMGDGSVKFVMGDGSVRTVGGHVKVFDAAGVNVWEVPIKEVAPGESDHIDISRSLLSHVGDPRTGRLQIRVEVLVVYEYQRKSSSGIMPPSFELINEDTGESLLIGMLLPAIQK